MTKPMFQGYETPQDYINEGIIPIEPMTAKEEGRDHLLEDMLNSSGYVAEDKLDGTRATLHIFKDHIRVFSRRISKKTGWYTENTDSLPHIRDIAIPELAGTIIDAELTMPSGKFKDIASTMNCNWDKAIARQSKLGFVQVNAFDCIYFKNEDLQGVELLERKFALRDVIEALDVEYINEVRYFDEHKAVVVTVSQRAEILENKEKYPTLYREIVETCGLNDCRALKSDVFRLGKKAYYEYYVMRGGEGIILKDKKGLYHQKRGREYTKVKKYLTKDVVVTGFEAPTREYLGKNRNTWEYWEDINTGNKYQVDADTSEGMSLLNDPTLNLEPISKYHYMNWIGTITYGVAITEEELETWKKINPKEECLVDTIDGVMYLGVGETSGLTEEERAEFSNNKEDYIGTVIEVKAHEVIKKTGKFRHPRFLRTRPDKAPETCTIFDHLG